MSRNRIRAGFTLVELLVVIGVIGVLVSILIPVLGKVRRKAIVLACPIAFRGFADNSLHLTDEQGRYDLVVAAGFAERGRVELSSPMWSPSGTRIAFGVSDARLPSGPQRYYIVVLTPMSGEMSKIRSTDGSSITLGGWYDEDHIVHYIGDHQTCVIREAGSGRVVDTVQTSLCGYPLYPCPRGLPGKWVTMLDGGVIRYVKADLSLGKVVYAGPYPGGQRLPDAGYYPIKVDPMGEWIAWNASDGSRVGAALKETRAPSSTPPTFVFVNDNLHDNSGAIFAEWTDDGNMLFCVEGGLAVAKKDGTELRRFATDDRPNLGQVSWRRYWH